MRKQDEEEKWRKILNIPFVRGDLVRIKWRTTLNLEGTPLWRLVYVGEIFLVLGLKGRKVRISDGEKLLAEVEDLETIKSRKEREIQLTSETELLNLDTESYEKFPEGTKLKIKAEKEGLIFLRKGDSYFIAPMEFLEGREDEKDKGT